MVEIFSDKNGSGEFVIQTTAVDTDTFISELAEAMHLVVSKANDGGLACMGIMKNAMPIAYKLSGYKADSVYERRTLLCGVVSPLARMVVASAGR